MYFLIAFVFFTSGACVDDGKRAITTRSEERVSASVVSVNNQSFSSGGAAAGYLLSSKNRLGWGIVGGNMAAKGCRIGLSVESTQITLRSPGRNCRTMKVGDEVTILITVYTTQYKDGTSGVSKYYNW